MNIEERLNVWLNGIEEEILFWDNYMRTHADGNEIGFKWTTASKKQFTLEEEIDGDASNCNYIDVGSGPFSRCGTFTKKTNLAVTAVDPLGYVYEKLKRKYGCGNDVYVRTWFVELLDKLFACNKFDLVHMSNALDHSFDPILGIYQLLRICKIGGKVVLRHNESIADYANYTGLHQWNLSLKKKSEDFFIFNKNEEYSVSEIFSDYAEIELYPDEPEINDAGSTEVFNRVVFKKKKEISIPQNDYYETILRCIYINSLENRFEKVISK